MTERLVTVATFETPFEAEVAKGRLESEGHTVFLADAETVTANWLYSNAVGGVRVQVPEPEADQARASLADSAPETESEWTAAEDYARRAFIASAAGLAFPPLQLYALYLLAHYLGEAEDESAQTRRRALWAGLLLIPWGLLIIVTSLS